MMQGATVPTIEPALAVDDCPRCAVHLAPAWTIMQFRRCLKEDGWKLIDPKAKLLAVLDTRATKGAAPWMPKASAATAMSRGY
jgi:hypothetical protein